MTRRKATAREHEPGKSDRQGEREPDRDQRSSTGRCEHAWLPSAKVHARVTVHGRLGWGKILIKT